MKSRPFLPSVLLLALAPLAAFAVDGFDPELDDEAPAPVVTKPAKPAEAPYKEVGPSDLKTYLTNKKTPRYLRVNIAGYNVRSSTDFSPKRNDNIDFRTKGGDVFAVEAVQQMAYGAAVQVHVDDELRWVYVPFSKKEDFQFCESEACFNALADSLDFFLRGSSVQVDQARSCGVSAGPEGLVLPPAAPQPLREPDRIPMPRPRPNPGPGRPTTVSVRPLWEVVKGAQGEAWTRMMGDALEKNGQGLLNQRNISDAASFCPNYSRLNPAQRKEFYIHLFNGIARYESNFKTSTPVFDEDRYKARTPPYNIYRGPIKPNSYSMGLFQQSYSAAPGYKPACGIDYARDRGKDISDGSLTIYDPKIQMECAVAVMNKWVTKDGGIGLTKDVYDPRTGRNRFRGGANYWSTLRSTNPASRELIGSLRRFTPCWK